MNSSAPGNLPLVLLDDLVDHLRGRVVGLRVVGRHLAVLGAVRLHEGLRSSACRSRRCIAAPRRGRSLRRPWRAARTRHSWCRRRSPASCCRTAASCLGNCSDIGPTISEKIASASALMRRDVRPEVLGAERRPDLLDDLPAAGLEGALEAADHLVAEGVVGADRDDLLVALFAGPLAERMARLRARPAGADQVRDTSARSRCVRSSAAATGRDVDASSQLVLTGASA